MADINTVIAKITDALNEACDVAGVPHLSDQVATLTAEVAAVTTQRDALQAKINAAKADLG